MIVGVCVGFVVVVGCVVYLFDCFVIGFGG